MMMATAGIRRWHGVGKARDGGTSMVMATERLRVGAQAETDNGGSDAAGTGSAGADADAVTVPKRWRRRLLAAAAFALFAATAGFLVGGEVQAKTQFALAHASIESTRHRIDAVLGDLASVRGSLHAVNGEVDANAAALASDTAELRSVQGALAQAQANVSAQGSNITALNTCLGGVEKAMNALSVGDQASAIAALNATSASCQSYAVSGG
jgi:hypothetical protein